MSCAITSVRYVRITWTATALGATFGFYEIQRSDDAAVTWNTIATVSTEATVAFNDYEAPRATLVSYRLRVVRLDGSVSAWTSTLTATCPPQSCEFVFTSNNTPTLNTGYDGGPEITYEWRDDVVFHDVYGRNFPLAFRPTEQHGTRFSIPVTIEAGAAPGTIGGETEFNTIRNISLADLPYVRVMDWLGNAWYASLRVADGVHTEPGYRYVAEVEVTEIKETPTPVAVP